MKLPGRRAVISVAVVVVAALAVVTMVVVRPFSGHKPASTGAVDNGSATGIATVNKQSLAAHTSVSATLGFDGTYSVVDQADGKFTELPSVGDLIEQGQRLYAVDGHPVALLIGSTPAYRTMVQGVRGPDVSELNADLVALGDVAAADVAAADLYSAATAAGVAKLQGLLGLQATGVLTLGQAVFLLTAARITAVSASVGAVAQPGAAVATATSTSRVVVVKLAAALQSQVKVGDQVTITLPDNSSTPGVVTTVGKVAVSTTDQGGNASAPTIEVDITPSDASATGTLDQAPVQVAITTASVDDAIVVPVAALLSPAGGGYAVEVVDSGASAGGGGGAGGAGVHRLIAVTLGIFDDADGLVQITESSLKAGDHVVVPGS